MPYAFSFEITLRLFLLDAVIDDAEVSFLRFFAAAAYAICHFRCRFR